jgi:aspartate racemase
MRKLGIIGGLGPFATIEFLDKFYNLYRQTYTPKKDQDFPNVSIEMACSTPDRTSFILGKDYSVNPKDSLKESIIKLLQLGANTVFCPCNTVYYFLEDAFNEVKALTNYNTDDLILISPIKEAAEFIMQNFYNKAMQKPVLILGTDGTIFANTYKTEFLKHGINVLYPDADMQDAVMKIIYSNEYGIKLNGKNNKACEELKKVLKFYQYKSSLALLACSELPICYNSKDELVFDPIEIACYKLVKIL